MRAFFHQLLCFLLGIHDWEQPPLPIQAIFPAPSDHRVWRRYCRRCGVRQYWLPGYGGSTLGSWEKED